MEHRLPWRGAIALRGAEWIGWLRGLSDHRAGGHGSALRPGAAAYFQNAFGLEGKVALITGAREGIGAATAMAFAHAGADLALTSRTEAGLAEIAGAARAAGANVLPLALEMRDVAQIRDTVSRVRQHFGRLDVLVNNAGIAIRSESLNYSESDWEEVMQVNLRGAFFAAQEAARLMVDGGRIINLSSVFAHTALASRVAYSASKAGLEQMTRVLAVEWAGRGINVNCVAPATIDTPTRAHLFPTPELLEARLRMIPVGRLGVPEDVAPAVLYLASPAAAFVTGATLMVDGGMSID